MNCPLVSVVIPTKDRYDLVKGSIENVRQQNYSNLEIVIVEDGSKSGISDYISNLNDNRIKYFRQDDCKGLAVARNVGVNISKGKFIAFLDDDDRWLNDKIRLQVEVIEKHSNDDCMVFCWTCKVINGIVTQGNNSVIRGSMTEHFYKGFTLPSSCMIIPKSLLLSIGGHSEELKSCVDHDLWMKMAKAGYTIDLVPMGLVYCPEHHHSKMINRLDERLEGIKQFFEKWKPIVIKEATVESWYHIERLYHMQTAKIILDQKKKGLISKELSIDYLQELYELQDSKVTIPDKFAFALEFHNLTPFKNRRARFFNKFFSSSKI